MAKKYQSVEEMNQAKLDKANRPFFKKKRFYLGVGFLLLIVIIISSCVNAANEFDKAFEEEFGTEQVNLDSQDNADTEAVEEEEEVEADSDSETIAFEDIVVYNDKGVKVSLVSIELDNLFESGEMGFKVENNYGKNVEVTIQNVSVDDVTYDSIAMFEVRNGKTQTDTYMLDYADGGKPEFVNGMELEIEITDPETYDTIDSKVFTREFK